MTTDRCPDLIDDDTSHCDATQLIDCKLPKTNAAADLPLQAISPLPVMLSLAPVVRLHSGNDVPRVQLRQHANLPPPPPNLRNAILLI